MLSDNVPIASHIDPHHDPEETPSCSAADQMGRQSYLMRNEGGAGSRKYNLSLVNHRVLLVGVGVVVKSLKLRATLSSAPTAAAQNGSSTEHQAHLRKWAFQPL